MITKETWTREEEWVLFLMHNLVGNKWAQISGLIPGRTDNNIKNHWNSIMKKKIGGFEIELNELKLKRLSHLKVKERCSQTVALLKEICNFHIESLRRSYNEKYREVSREYSEETEIDLVEKKLIIDSGESCSKKQFRGIKNCEASNFDKEVVKDSHSKLLGNKRSFCAPQVTKKSIKKNTKIYRKPSIFSFDGLVQSSTQKELFNKCKKTFRVKELANPQNKNDGKYTEQDSMIASPIRKPHIHDMNSDIIYSELKGNNSRYRHESHIKDSTKKSELMHFVTPAVRKHQLRNRDVDNSANGNEELEKKKRLNPSNFQLISLFSECSFSTVKDTKSCVKQEKRILQEYNNKSPNDITPFNFNKIYNTDNYSAIQSSFSKFSEFNPLCYYNHNGTTAGKIRFATQNRCTISSPTTIRKISDQPLNESLLDKYDNTGVVQKLSFNQPPM